MRSSRTTSSRLPFLAASVGSLLALAACGGAAPPPVAAPSAIAPVVASEPPPDVTAVPEPAGLILVGRVSKTNAILGTLRSWTHLPLPNGADLVRSISDDSIADAVDLSQPVDAAVSLGGGIRDPKPLIAVSVAVRSFDDAKATLSSKHKLTKGKNGQLWVEGVGRAAVTEGRGRSKEKGEEDDDEGETCVLAHASVGARLVCGERDALDALAPYLTRTVTRQTWASDVHVEVSLAAVREPLGQVRAMLPVLAKTMLGGSSPALAKLVDAGVNELVDLVGDMGRMTLDSQIGDSGVQATVKVEYLKAQSLIAQLSTSNPQRADAPPPAFWHLPSETDMALFGKGSDPKLFAHPKELLGNVFLEATEGAGMPEPERKAVRELVVDRMLGLFTGPLVYGKGYDAAAVDKALAARNALKSGDTAAADEAERLLAEQVLGWHLVQVSEPITKVGPMLKDWAQLWNRPAFAKWAKQQSSAKMLATMRIVPAPAGVTLPKDAVHLEIVMPRADIEELPPVPPQSRGAGSKPAPAPAAPKPALAKVKKIPRKPIVLHIIAVPDQGATWLGVGLDAKLLAIKAAASLSSAPDATSLAKVAEALVLRDAKVNAAWFATLRGVLVYTSLGQRSHSPFSAVSALPAKGSTPILLTFLSQGPSASAPGGSAVTTFKLPRGAIEDLVKLLMTR